MKLPVKFDVKKLVSLLGTLVMGIALYFVITRIIEMRDDIDFTVFANLWVLLPLLLLVLWESLIIIFTSENFRKLVVSISGVEVSRPAAIKAYNNGNIYKYIPSGVMLLLGRNQMAVETKGLKHRKVAFTTILEGAMWIVCALILSAVLALDYVVHYVRQLDLQYLGVAIGTIVPILLVLLFLLYRFRNKLFGDTFDLKSEIEGLKVTAVLKRLPVMLLIVGVWGSSFLVTMAILGQPLTLYVGVAIVGLYIMSWLIGFITPGAPGGLGIRELILLMFLGATVYEGLLLSAIVIHRGVQIAGDIVAFGIARGYYYLKSRQIHIRAP